MAVKELIRDTGLDVIGMLSTRVIKARVADLRREDELAIALRTALRSGIDINDLSEVSGLTPAEIQRQTNRPLYVMSELDVLAGVA